jgi:hypothetical protein
MKTAIWDRFANGADPYCNPAMACRLSEAPRPCLRYPLVSGALTGMKHLIARVVVAGGLIGLGWIAGTAQTRPGDFEVRIDAVAGTTFSECVRGCKLVGSRDVLNPRAGQMRKYEFSARQQAGARLRLWGFLQVGGDK